MYEVKAKPFVVDEEVPATILLLGPGHAGDDGAATLVVRRNINPRGEAEDIRLIEVHDAAQLERVRLGENRRRAERSVFPGKRHGGSNGKFLPGDRSRTDAVLRGRERKLQQFIAEQRCLGQLLGQLRLDGFGLPVGKFLIGVSRAQFDDQLRVLDLVRQFLPAFAIRLGGGRDHVEIAFAPVLVEAGLLGVPVKRRQRVKVLLLERIELVIVTGGAVSREAHEHPARCRDAIVGVEREVLVFDRAAFVGRDVAALEAGRHELVLGRVLQQVTRNLLDDELVEGLVGVVGVDHPVAIRPHLAVIVEVQAVRVGVARGIQPVTPAVLAPLLRRQQRIDKFLEVIWRRILHERLNLLGLWGKAGQVERQAAGQRPAIRLGIHRQAFFRELG